MKKRLKTFLYSMSFQKRLLLLSILLLIIPTSIMSVLLFINIRDSTFEITNNASQQTLAMIKENFSKVIDNSTLSLQFILSDKSLKTTVMSYNKNETPDIRVLSDSEKVLRNLQLINSVRSLQIFVFPSHGDETLTTETSEAVLITNILKEKSEHILKERILNSRELITLTPADSQIERNYLVLSSIMYDFTATDHIGVAFILIDVEQLCRMYFSSVNTETIYSLLSADGDVLYSSQDSDLTYEGLDFHKPIDGLQLNSNKKIYLLNTQELEFGDLIIAQSTPYHIVTQKLREQILDSALILFIPLALFIWILLIMIRQITNPLIKLTHLMDTYRAGNREVYFHTQYNDEIALLGNTFNQMVKTQNELMNQIKIEEHEKNELQLEVLMSQINPHFLLNTINSMQVLANLNGVESISQMAGSLCHLLDFSLYTKEEIITLSDELSIVEDYVKIQQFRFGADVKFIYQIAPETTQLLVPKMIIQPLVENSLEHAFDWNDKEKQITIRSQLYEDTFTISVSDSGNRFSYEKFQAILHNQSQKGKFNGIGLRNVHERIKLNFGSPYGLTYDSLSECTTININLPPVRNQASADLGAMYD